MVLLTRQQISGDWRSSRVRVLEDTCSLMTSTSVLGLCPPPPSAVCHVSQCHRCLPGPRKLPMSQCNVFVIVTRNDHNNIDQNWDAARSNQIYSYKFYINAQQSVQCFVLHKRIKTKHFKQRLLNCLGSLTPSSSSFRIIRSWNDKPIELSLTWRLTPDSDWLWAQNAGLLLADIWPSPALTLAWLWPPQSSVGPSLRRNTKMGFLAKTLYFTLSVSNYRLAHARPGFLDSKLKQNWYQKYWQFNLRSSVSPPRSHSKFKPQLDSTHISFWFWWVHYRSARSKLQESILHLNIVKLNWFSSPVVVLLGQDQFNQSAVVVLGDKSSDNISPGDDISAVIGQLIV